MVYSTGVILATRTHFIRICSDCIEDAVSGKQKVNDLPNYVLQQTQEMVNIGSGRYDHTFTFLQMAHYIETGECVPLLAGV